MDDVASQTPRNRWATPANAICSVVAICPPQRQRAGTSTDKTRVLSDLLDDVLQGFRTVQEAHTAYGEKPAGKGRKRRFSTFGDYLVDRIRYAEDPTVEQELRDLLVQSASRRHCGSGAAQRAARGAETTRVNRLLDETGADHAARLRELLAELAA